MMDEDMEKITKEWPKEFLVPIIDAELSDTDTIGSLIVTQVEHVRQSSGMKKWKKQDKVQNIESNEEDKTSGDNESISPGGGEDEAEGQGGGVVQTHSALRSRIRLQDRSSFPFEPDRLFQFPA
jgi:hypothetical protein